MSTNYYARTADTIGEGVHIGKRSGGWDFLFRAYPDDGITDCEAWHAYLSRPSVRIVSEHGVEYELAEFWGDAVKRPADVGGQHVMRCHDDYWRGHRDPVSASLADKQWTDKHGHPFANYEFC